MNADLLARLAAALRGGAATSTDLLQGLLLEAGGEKCWQRPRLLHRLSLILEANQPRMATATTHQFKPAFRGKDFSGFPLVVGNSTKIVTAANLTDEDVPLLQRHGGAHLLEPIGDAAAPTAEGDEAAPATPTNDFAPTGFPANFDYEQLVSDVADLVLSRIQDGSAPGFSVDGVETVNSGILQTAVEQNGDTTTVKHSSGGPDDLPITAPAALQAQVVTPEAKPETQPEPEDLSKFLKPALQARYKEVLGKDAPADMLKEDLIKAIEAGPVK